MGCLDRIEQDYRVKGNRQFFNWNYGIQDTQAKYLGCEGCSDTQVPLPFYPTGAPLSEKASFGVCFVAIAVKLKQKEYDDSTATQCEGNTFEHRARTTEIITVKYNTKNTYLPAS